MGNTVHEHHLPVSRTARYHTLGAPGPGTREVWVVCLTLWGVEFPPDLDLTLETVVERLRTARLSLVYGRADQFITPKVVAAIAQRLRAHDIPCRELPFDGEHEVNATVLTEVAAL